MKDTKRHITIKLNAVPLGCLRCCFCADFRKKKKKYAEVKGDCSERKVK
jgi:hypothetical protein